MKYIYVCTEEDRDKLLCLGFSLLGDKKEASSWAFVNDKDININLDDTLDTYVTSNVLMF